MTRNIMTTLILVFLVLSLIQKSEGQTGESSKLETEIGKVLRNYYDAFSRRDAAMTSAIYADDGFSYSLESGYENNRQVKEEVSAFLRSPMATASKDSYEIQDLKVMAVTADTAMANYTVVSKTEQNGKTDLRSDRTTNFFVRRDGRWLIVADHTSRMPNPVTPTGMPVGWKRNRGSDSYQFRVDTNVKHGGKASASVKFTCGGEAGFGSLSQNFAADDYRGKRIRLSGWLKTEDARAAGLWMRLDGDRRLLGFDNMLNRPVTGTTDWKRYEVVLDVPAETINIFIGTLIDGTGQLWVDDVKLEIVGKEVDVTNQLSAEQMQVDDARRNQKRSDIKQPVNLSFEEGTIP